MRVTCRPVEIHIGHGHLAERHFVFIFVIGMKHIMTILASAIVLASCSLGGVCDATLSSTYEESNPLVSLNISLEVPAGEDEVSLAVRAALLDTLRSELGQLAFCEEPAEIGACDASASSALGSSAPSDLDAVVACYGKSSFGNLTALASDDARQRAEYGAEGDFPSWDCCCNIKMVSATPAYWVYRSWNSVYLGGAHGGVTGAGYITFRKSDGRALKGIVDASRTIELQPVLRGGVIDYLNGCLEEVSDAELDSYLFVEDGIIPLPRHEPYPAAEGLVFVYQQYEIAPYAMGMPEFTVPYDVIREYLSDEAKDLLGL